MTTLPRRGLTPLLCFLSLCFTHIVDAAEPNFTVRFVGRPATLVGYGPVSYTGHVYVVLTVKTSMSLKEEAYGFYPARGGLGLLKGPGMLTKENRCSGGEVCSGHDLIKKLGHD